MLVLCCDAQRRHSNLNGGRQHTSNAQQAATAQSLCVLHDTFFQIVAWVLRQTRSRSELSKGRVLCSIAAMCGVAGMSGLTAATSSNAASQARPSGARPSPTRPSQARSSEARTIMRSASPCRELSGEDSGAWSGEEFLEVAESNETQVRSCLRPASVLCGFSCVYRTWLLHLDAAPAIRGICKPGAPVHLIHL